MVFVLRRPFEPPIKIACIMCFRRLWKDSPQLTDRVPLILDPKPWDRRRGGELLRLHVVTLIVQSLGRRLVTRGKCKSASLSGGLHSDAIGCLCLRMSSLSSLCYSSGKLCSCVLNYFFMCVIVTVPVQMPSDNLQSSCFPSIRFSSSQMQKLTTTGVHSTSTWYSAMT